MIKMIKRNHMEQKNQEEWWIKIWIKIWWETEEDNQIGQKESGEMINQD